MTYGSVYRTAAALLLVLAAALTGCTGQHRPRLAVPDSTVCPTTAKGPIRLATGSDLSSTGVRGHLVQWWNQHCPDHPVQLVELAADADLQRSQMVAAEQSGGARYDVLNLDVTWTAEFARAGLIRELPWSARDDFLNSARRTAEFDGKVWGRPFNTDAGLLYYRLDMLRSVNTPDSAPDRHGPASWAELQQDVATVTKSLDRRTYQAYRAGYITQLRDYEGLTVNALEAVWAAGGDLVRPDGTVATTQELLKAQTGLGTLAQRVQDHTLIADSARTADETDSEKAFESGQVVFMRNWPYAYSVLARHLTPGVDFDVTTLPGDGQSGQPGISVLGGQNLAVTSDSAQPEAAAALIGFLTSPQSERCLLEGGFAATRESAYSSGPDAPSCVLDADGKGPGGTASASPTAESSGHGGAVNGDDGLPRYARTLSTALHNARPRPVTPYYEAFTHEMQTRVGSLLEDTSRQQPVTAELTTDLGPILQGRD